MPKEAAEANLLAEPNSAKAAEQTRKTANERTTDAEPETPMRPKKIGIKKKARNTMSQTVMSQKLIINKTHDVRH